MKRFWNKLLCIVLVFALVLGLGASFIACKDSADEGQINTPPRGEEVFEETDFCIIENAKSPYKIVIPSDADGNERLAGNELQSFFFEATGITLPIIYDDGLTFNEDVKYFSIGENKLSQSAQITVDIKELKSQGFHLKTVGQSVFMLGATSYGSLYAVYEYLHRDFNYEYFFTDVYSLNKNVTELKLKAYDLTVVPDIDKAVVPNVGYIMYNAKTRARFKCMATPELYVPANKNTQIHNIFSIIDPNVFAGSHPDWFTSDKKQACFTAHYNETGSENRNEYNAMQAEFLNVIIRGLKESSATIFQISQNDNAGFCGCKTCIELKSKYGVNSAIMILFMNDLVEKVYDWFETPGGKPYARDFYLYALFYQDIKSAPVKKGSTNGEYVPVAPEIVMHDKVGAYLAYDNFNSGVGIQENATNKSLYENTLQWAAVCKNFGFWIYDVMFNNYFYPFDTSAYKQDFYKLMNSIGTQYVNDQGQTQNSVHATSWNNLKAYLSSKFRWNVNADETALTKAFFDNCYKTAAGTMYEIYLQYKAHWAELTRLNKAGELGITNFGGIFVETNTPTAWSMSMLTSWYDGFKKALSELEPLKATDPESYEKAYNMIVAELASPTYMLYDLYASEYSESDLRALGKEFKEYCTIAQINYYRDASDSGAVENLYQQMGID